MTRLNEEGEDREEGGRGREAKVMEGKGWERRNKRNPRGEGD